MSITISKDLQVHILSLGAGQSESFKLLTPENAPESFAILRRYISPLEVSKVSSDKDHYRTMVQSISHFNQTEEDYNGVNFPSQEISNWQALNLVTSLWDTFKIAVSGDSRSSVTIIADNAAPPTSSVSPAPVTPGASPQVTPTPVPVNNFLNWLLDFIK